MTFKAYYELTKPGIIYGNALVAAAGFFFAARGHINWLVFLAMLVGLSLVVASACVLNNIYDRDIDARMARTKNRAIVTGTISRQSAAAYALVLGLAGGILFGLYVPALALAAALAGFAVYVLFYTPLKPVSPWALFVGAIAGATPPLVGYLAVTGSLDGYAWALFIAMYLWQLPHFMAIATYRYPEYAAAGVPLFITHDPSPMAKKWGRGIFYASLVVLLVACVVLMLHR
ncbi:MAG TPA: protoheme IX farnesyltransferase [Candidatus Paceibacterota bacterium]|nr:protoheme IX farnesyltransferase [Candidatus Paceibacterota bacterium]